MAQTQAQEEENYPVIQSVERERARHKAESDAAAEEFRNLSNNEKQLEQEVKRLREKLNSLPDAETLDKFAARIHELENENDTLENEIHTLKGLTPEQIQSLRAEQLISLANRGSNPEQISSVS